MTDPPQMRTVTWRRSGGACPFYPRPVGHRGAYRTLGIDEPRGRRPRMDPASLILLKPRADFYRTALPRPADVLLLIEIADTSLRYDRNVTLPLYVEGGVEEYWIVDLDHDVVELHREPAGDGYRSVERVGRGSRVAPRAFPDFVLAVDEILGVAPPA